MTTKTVRFSLLRCLASGAVLACFAAGQLMAATVTVLNEDFESYTGPATSFADESDADPDNLAINIADDNPVAGAGAAESGVQLQNYQVHGGNNALLVRPGSEAQIYLNNTTTGSRYQWDFWIYSARGASSSHNFYLILRGEGSDNNGDDYLAYRSDRATNSTALYYYDGVGPAPSAAWTAVGASHAIDQWQHHRIVIDPNAQTFTLYLDDMNTPVLADADLSRSQVAAPTILRIVNEGNSADDGFFAIDDLSLTVDDGVTLASTFTEGFESYPARVAADDDADPLGPWITTETEGTGASTASRAPAKVQVVDNTVVPAHSGTKCLKLEGGQRAGSTIAWGVPPMSDVQITWWARVPASVDGQTANYLRMSLYGAENLNTIAGDNALLGYGSRDGTIGDETSLTFYSGGWIDSGIDYTPDTWEQYRLTTHTAQGRYTIIKNPNGANPVVIVDRSAFIGSATDWSPVFMAAWSSSNGSGHPPVYIDDIEIRSLVSNPDPLPDPYTVQIEGSRFTNSTILPLTGPIGATMVDPRDNTTIVFAVDAGGGGGGIFKATKVASGNWAADPTPIVSGLSNPSGMTIQPDGTLWWAHDFTTAIMRLKWPWSENTPEMVIADFILPGATTTTFADDDPFDVCFPPSDFNGSIANSSQLVIMDRGVDANPNNALLLLDPATTELAQTNYETYLFGPSTTALGSADLVALTPLLNSELATLCVDGQVTTVDANGFPRVFWPDFYADPFIPIQPSSMAVDPDTGRLWIADDLTNEVWSCATDGTAGARELAFPLTNLERPSDQIDFAEPGMSFAKDGSILVISDSSTANGGGRLIILHNEPVVVPGFKLATPVYTGTAVELNWEPAGSVSYKVERATSLAPANFTDISGVLTGTTFTDNAPPAGGAFYRVVIAP